MPRQIQGSQNDFSFGEVDVALKRADQHPARKAGLRQMANARILNSGSVQDRPGRRALFPATGARIEEVTMSPGNKFFLCFGNGSLSVFNTAGAQVFTTTKKADGATNIPWTAASVKNISWALTAPANQFSVYICYGDDAPANVPQILTWDGVSQTSSWSLATFIEEVALTGQKRTPFYRISPGGITLAPSATSGSVNIVFSAPVLVPAMIGTRLEYCGAQLTITGVTDSEHGTATCDQVLPPGLALTTTGGLGVISLGQEVIGSITGAIGIVISVGISIMTVQLIQTANGDVLYFNGSEDIVGPNGYVTSDGTPTPTAPQAVVEWSDEVMNFFRGFPASVFYDQARLGLCNFPSIPSGIGWSAINAPSDFYPEDVSSADNAIFEIAPGKVQVLFVVAGPESSEFIFCDTKLYYIPISPTDPLKPGSVSFQLLSGDGCARVQPRLAQEAILYVNAGRNCMMAVIATGAYTRPFNTKILSEFHSHLFSNIQAIAAPSADGTFLERYAYVLNADGSIAVGKYQPDSLQGNNPVIGWGPWSGAASISWVAALNADVIFTSTYFGVGICEVLDDTQYLDCALSVNALPVPFTPPAGKGPLFFIAGQSVTLMDQVTRAMGTYQIDANGFIVPQNNGGENLAIASLVAGQPWTMTVEPFAQDAQSGSDMHQRMLPRRISYFAVYVINSTGLVLAKLFSGKLTPTSPALGTIINTRRVPAWNMGDDATKPPPLRETVEEWRPAGYSYDPRVAIIKDTPGPLLIDEIAMEISI